MPHPYDILALENGSQLIFTPCPGSKDAGLVDSLLTLKQAGTNALITLMYDEDMEANNILSLPDECEKLAIKWFQLPILDDAAPNHDFESQWQKHITAILSIIHNKGTIAVHCKGGTGRTGLVISLILLAYGWPAEKVIKAVQTVRPKALKIPVQVEYFNAYVNA